MKKKIDSLCCSFKISFRLFRSLKKKTKKMAKKKVHGERTSSKTRTSLSKKSRSTSVKKEKSDSENTREEMSDNRDETVKMEKVFCDICKVTILEKNYTKHMLKHSNINGFQCDVCSRKYKHKRTMTKHKLYAHGDAPTYNCQHCDFTTIHSSYLQVSRNERNSASVCLVRAILLNYINYV